MGCLLYRNSAARSAAELVYFGLLKKLKYGINWNTERVLSYRCYTNGTQGT